MGGKQFELVASWAASLAISQNVCDPVTIATEAYKAEEFASKGIFYRQTFEFNLVNSVAIIFQALKANGYDLTEEQVGEMAMEDPLQLPNIASAFIALIVNNGPEKKPKGRTKKASPRRGKQSAKTLTD